MNNRMAWDEVYFGTCAEHGLFPVEIDNCPVCDAIDSETEVDA